MRAVRQINKAARNEGRKLAATFLNNIGVGFFLAATLQPAVGYVREAQALTLPTGLLMLVLVATSLMCVGVAQAIARRIEE